MADTRPIPLVVLSRQQDPVEIINSALRNAGHPVHCAWIRDLADLGDALGQHSPQLIFMVLNDLEEARAALELRRRLATRVPTILVRDALTEQDLVRGIELGAQDVVTLAARARLQAVATRELQSSRLDQTLSGTLASARSYRDQMKAFMTGSTDAIAHVQEGIVVDVNPAWMELFGFHDPNALVGQPLMDHFEASSHAALKGALVAAAQGRWSDHSLSTTAVQHDGTRLPLELAFEQFEFEGEPAIRLRVATQRRDLESLTRQLDDAMRHDAATGLLRRTAFLERANARAGQTLKGGLRAIAYFEPDKLATLEAEHGPLAIEEFLSSVGTTLHAQLQPGDLAARVSPAGFAVLFERGNSRDLEAWVNLVLGRLAATPHKCNGGQIKATCSAGAVTCLAGGEPIARPLQTAIDAQRDAARAGGNRVMRRETAAPGKPELGEADRTWAAQIKSALRLIGQQGNPEHMRHDAAQWHPDVIRISGLKGEGLDEFWQCVTRFRDLQTANGKLVVRRQQQARAWMGALIDSGLKAAFNQHPAVRASLAAVTEQVTQGRLPPSTAARQLLAAAGFAATAN